MLCRIHWPQNVRGRGHSPSLGTDATFGTRESRSEGDVSLAPSPQHSDPMYVWETGVNGVNLGHKVQPRSQRPLLPPGQDGGWQG